MKNIPTVSIAISALNEADNIQSLVVSLLNQKEIGFSLEKIYIASDGSTDDTVAVIRKLRSKKIEVKAYKTRKGKAFRLKQLFQKIDTDIVVQIDADIRIKSREVLSNIIKPLSQAPNVGMTGANAQPLEVKTFMQKAIHSSFRPYAEMRKFCNSLSIGPMLAFKTKLAKKIIFPENIIGEDIFAYFTCLTHNFTYKYVKNAVVYFQFPKNVSDHIAQNVRFLQSPRSMERYFPKELLRKEDYIPFMLYVRLVGGEIIRHPVLTLFIFIVNQYCRLIAKLRKGTINGNWHVSRSTKISGFETQ